ncbi:hypothetical protein BHF71_02245 [Vulcanibacillus modesticaldus]|uniref:TVP38/TMEM64 family membrane protein n=2 Tax=Vulcanibacillus modesticaldus TaxID=337097 RepID=A0A1D2YTK5_9BACI|nr:VTT domain-containing protein [Vulcanibacillus modesticaldus]OEF99033.1 hypothetical protein BHF71_02245 [Vulcanibacillus modesticaldus]
MELEIISLFENYKEFAVIISLLINVIIAILGVIPSVFITGANLVFFGFWEGVLISFLGEALGAIIAFVLYRKGFRNISVKILNDYPKIKKIIELEGKEAFVSIISLRLMPFIPSGVVTMAGAIGKVSLLNFAVSSSIGKIPALLIEGISVYNILSFTIVGKIILIIIGIIALRMVIKSIF